jgi:Protein of unknown function (DUF3379)
MNCEEFRQQIGAEPTLSNAEIEAHAASCPACAKYRNDLLQMDQLIHRALSIEVKAPTKSVVRRQPMRWASAAIVLIGILTASVLWLSSPRDSLARDLVAHTKDGHGPMVRTSQDVDRIAVAHTLARAGIGLRPDDLAVSYVQLCEFRGHGVPHLVIQTPEGPVTVLVLADEKTVQHAEHFNEGGYEGVILPAPRGSIASLSNRPDAEAVGKKVLAALNYESKFERPSAVEAP